MTTLETKGRRRLTRRARPWPAPRARRRFGGRRARLAGGANGGALSWAALMAGLVLLGLSFKPRDAEARARFVGSANRTHLVRAGETLAAIARRYRVNVRQLRTWNPGLRASRLMTGQRLRICTDGCGQGSKGRRKKARRADRRAPHPGRRRKRYRSPSQSIGYPAQGRLLRGVRLRSHRGFVVRDPRRAWTTHEVVRYMRSAFTALHQRFRRTPRVEVRDLSVRHGGYIDGHVSHQSGRDVDIAFIARSCGRKPCTFRRVSPRTLDVPRQWALLSYWLRRDQLEAAFMDYALQRKLYWYAKKRGATPQQLLRWFQYPRGEDHPGGTIRHYDYHDDHLHVRFSCHYTDPRCRAVRVVAEAEKMARGAKKRRLFGRAAGRRWGKARRWGRRP